MCRLAKRPLATDPSVLENPSASPLSLVEPESLLVKIAEQVVGLDADVGSLDTVLEEATRYAAGLLSRYAGVSIPHRSIGAQPQ